MEIFFEADAGGGVGSDGADAEGRLQILYPSFPSAETQNPPWPLWTPRDDFITKFALGVSARGGISVSADFTSAN